MKTVTALILTAVLVFSVAHAEEPGLPEDKAVLERVDRLKDDPWEGKTVISIAAGICEEQDATQGEISIEVYSDKINSVRVGYAFYSNVDDRVYMGIDLTARWNMPYPISPFVGIGLFGGQWNFYEPAEDDGLDNDDDYFVDEDGERKEFTEYLLAIYPEAGLHIWLGPHVRLTASARYYMSTDGRNSDRLLYGVGVGFSF